MGTPSASAGSSSASGNSSLTAAQQACKAKGLTPGSSDFQTCVKNSSGGTTGSSTAPSASSPTTTTASSSGTTLQQAQQQCAAQGLTPGSSQYQQCVQSKVGH
jgi:hypothetical protein